MKYVFRKRSVISLLQPSLMLGLLLTHSACAQLYGDYLDTEALSQRASNVVFGTVKNSDGDYLSDATVVLQTQFLDFVAVTNENGRFRFELPEEINAKDLKTGCSLPGHAIERLIRRLPRGGATSPTEINCVLKSIGTSP